MKKEPKLHPCPKCGKACSVTHIYCGECGTKVKGGVKRTCPKCGKDTRKPDRKFCVKCGTAYDSQPGRTE
jgi:uncharacterized membrane protein YvbJ